MNNNENKKNNSKSLIQLTVLAQQMCYNGHAKHTFRAYELYIKGRRYGRRRNSE